MEARHAEHTGELHPTRIEAEPLAGVALSPRPDLDDRVGAVEYVVPLELVEFQ